MPNLHRHHNAENVLYFLCITYSSPSLRRTVSITHCALYSLLMIYRTHSLYSLYFLHMMLATVLSPHDLHCSFLITCSPTSSWRTRKLPHGVPSSSRLVAFPPHYVPPHDIPCSLLMEYRIPSPSYSCHPQSIRSSPPPPTIA